MAADISMRVVSRDDSCSLDEKGVKNQWNWNWLEKEPKLSIKVISPKFSWKGEPVVVFVGAFVKTISCVLVTYLLLLVCFIYMLLRNNSMHKKVLFVFMVC